MKNSVEPFNFSVMPQARDASLARTSSALSSSEFVEAGDGASTVTDDIRADTDLTAATTNANGLSDKSSDWTNSSFRSRKYSMQYSANNGQSSTRTRWRGIFAAHFRNAIPTVTIWNTKKPVPPQVNNSRTLSATTVDDQTHDNMMLTDFRKDARRVLLRLVVAFLFPVACAVFAGLVVGTSDTIQMERVTTSGNTTTSSVVAYAASYPDQPWSTFACSRQNSTVFLSTCLAGIQLDCSAFLSDFAYRFYQQRLVLFRYDPLTASSCSTSHRNTPETNRYDDNGDLADFTVLYPTNVDSVFDFSSTSCCSTSYRARNTSSPCHVFIPTNASDSLTSSYPSCYSLDVDRTSIYVTASLGSIVGLVFIVSAIWFAVIVVTRFHRQRLRSLLESFDAAEVQLDQVRAEQRRSNGLLADMLPRSIADKLKTGQTIEPETFDQVTVYFSDIPGFHDSAHHCDSPIDIVTLLNDVFR